MKGWSVEAVRLLGIAYESDPDLRGDEDEDED
jgi:hypothetical protein